jgi:hypothetical protein
VIEQVNDGRTTSDESFRRLSFFLLGFSVVRRPAFLNRYHHDTSLSLEMVKAFRTLLRSLDHFHAVTTSTYDLNYLDDSTKTRKTRFSRDETSLGMLRKDGRVTQGNYTGTFRRRFMHMRVQCHSSEQCIDRQHLLSLNHASIVDIRSQYAVPSLLHQFCIRRRLFTEFEHELKMDTVSWTFISISTAPFQFEDLLQEVTLGMRCN